jgi:hypothetical protein
MDTFGERRISIACKELIEIKHTLNCKRGDCQFNNKIREVSI